MTTPSQVAQSRTIGTRVWPADRRRLTLTGPSKHEIESGSWQGNSSADQTPLPSEPVGDRHATGLPPDLQAQSARRLRIVAVLYAIVFFVSDPLTAILFTEEREVFLSNALHWGPSVASIVAALLVAAMTRSKRLPVGTVLLVGVFFQVVGSFGIAAAQYLDVDVYTTPPPWAGLSWVAVWMLGFTVMIPTPPRWALSAALASASAVPLVVGFEIVTAGGSAPITPLRFFIQVALPYLLVVLVAYVGGRVVYCIGTQLKRERELGSYRLIDRLGQGGMGEVWRAEHRLLVRPAAIKLMRPEMAGPARVGLEFDLHARFEREAQATSSLRSPHTIELYDFGVADDGTFYYVMELLDGFDLQRFVERFGPIPPERAVHLMKQVCHSLAEAHGQGLIHRDIKPANVYLCRYGRDVDFVKVLDFGLVKPQHDRGSTQLDVTAAHVARGTPAFMSPEQVVGARAVDARSDIYAVGCLGYWLLTGQLVFAGHTAMETILKHVQAKPEPPSQHVESDIPESFDELILACLEKNPDDRPPTTDAVATRLNAIETREEWSQERAHQWWDLHHPAQPLGGLT
jgi:eukaryotic-like serine/threonine-protein kinase